MEIQIAALKLIPLNGSCEAVQKGSLVKIDGMWVLVATAIGRMSWNGLNISVISPASPLALELLDKKQGDVIVIAGKEQRIEEIL
jgi:transcription elongation GreA/GreB family factor